ncbi:hypothetical protein D9M69_642750 [compost metagenome]
MAVHVGEAAVAAGLRIRSVVQPVMILMRLEIGQAILPGPGVIADRRRPAVEIARLAAHIDHAVDRGAAAERLAARIAQRPAVQSGVRFGLVQPVGARIADAIEVADGDVNPVIVVLSASF